MTQMFVQPLWFVPLVDGRGNVARVTLKQAREEARFCDRGPGSYVTAEDASDAWKIACRSQCRDNDVQRIDAKGVIVFMAAPRW